MDDLCNIKINPAIIGCDTSTRAPVTVIAERLANGTIVILEPGSFTEEQLKALGDEFEKARVAGEKMNEALKMVPELPAIRTPMQPHNHRNDVLPYYKGKHSSRVHYRVPKHHMRKTGRR